MTDSFEWIRRSENEWDIHTQDRKIAILGKDAHGYFCGDTADRFGDPDELIRLIHNGHRDGFTGARI